MIVLNMVGQGTRWDPKQKDPTVRLSNRNRTMIATGPVASPYCGVLANAFRPPGKWYFEIISGGMWFGVGTADFINDMIYMTNATGKDMTGSEIRVPTSFVSLNGRGGIVWSWGAGFTPVGGSMHIGVALDNASVNSRYWLGNLPTEWINGWGTWGGDPANGVGGYNINVLTGRALVPYAASAFNIPITINPGPDSINPGPGGITGPPAGFSWWDS